jgi:hypothetical protein
MTCLAGCSPATLEDLRCQGEAETLQLAKVLRGLETKEDVQKALPKIKKRFNRIAVILGEVRKFPNPPPLDPTMASEELFIELSRLYEIPGAREWVEGAEEEAVQKLSREF